MKIKKKSNTVRVPPLKKPIKLIRKSTDIEEESTVSKALQNVKKVLEKKNDELIKTIVTKNITKTPKIKKSNRKVTHLKTNDPRGIVYLGHIPHGFYEEEMTEYFAQFGKVTRARIVRSKNSGRSRGYGYIEFLHPDVAKIAAETMNNYLMCGRLLKATYIPPEKQHVGFFAGKAWTKEVYPKKANRSNVTNLRNANVTKQKHTRSTQSIKDKLSALQKKLSEKGFDLKFTPIDNTKI